MQPIKKRGREDLVGGEESDNEGSSNVETGNKKGIFGRFKKS